jgi:hypothetical protein
MVKTMRTENIANDVNLHFVVNNFEWKLKDGGKAIPTADDLERTFDEMKRRLDESDDANRIEVGRLVVIRTGEHDDLYVHFGEI